MFAKIATGSVLTADDIKRTGKTLTELAGIVTRLPQILVNVGGVDKAAANS